MSELPVILSNPAEGEPFPGLGGLLCKIPASSTGDAFTLLELRLGPREGAPLHVHQREDEIIFVREGTCLVGQRDQEWTLQPGSSALFPKGTAHFFRNAGEHPCILLITAIPGGLDRYFAAISAALQQNQPETIPAINEQYGITFLPTTNAGAQ
jgi:mannose-6-phosphate isomerase-like protein (cupin superfamily)